MATWGALPSEIRLSIMEMVAGNGKFEHLKHGQSNDQATSKTSAYASVSREWQAFFEKRHFERILLSLPRLSDFGRIVQGLRKKLVRHIGLQIKLTTYDCPSCRFIEHVTEVSLNNTAFVQTLTALFTVLSTWEPYDLKEGLTLELCIYSPSDSKHMFKDHNFEHDPYLDDNEEFRTLAAPRHMGPRFHDPFHSWHNGYRSLQPGEEEHFLSNITRLQGHGLYIVPPAHNLDPPYSARRFLPKVNVVTTLLILRQYYRQIDPDGMAQLFESLPKLKHINYEPLESLFPPIKAYRDKRKFILAL